MKKKLMVVLVLGVCLVLSGCSSPTKDAFNAAAKKVEAENAELDKTIDSLQVVINSGETPLDNAVLQGAETVAATVRSVEFEIPEMPSSDEDIKAATEEMDKVDYTTQLEEVEKAKIALETSYAQMKQLTNPSESFVVERLREVSSVTGISAVTEENDPNGKLNKQGGYTASIYFTDSMVDQGKVSGESIIDKGTKAGGCIEAYATVEAAEARNTYLSAFDGSILSTGSHVVVGTIVVRTSDYLTATQQKELTAEIIEKLSEIR